MSKLDIAVENLRDELCNKYCPICPVNCCTGRLNISFRENINFRGIPVLKNRWQLPPKNGVYITDRRFWFLGKCYLIGRCPYLSDEGVCGIHEKTDRPEDCVKYPLYISRGFPFFSRQIKAEKSCFIFGNGSNCRKVIELGQKFNTEVLIVE